MELIKKNDCIEIEFTGYSNGIMFDSNIPDNLKKINPDAKAEKTILIVGQHMVVEGLDKSLEGKEIGKEYEIKVSANEGFGERKRELMKTIPLKIFTEKNISPKAGMVLSLDGMIAKIVAVSGGRIMTDFNNPLAGKDLVYKFKILRKVDDEKEKCDAIFNVFLKFIPKYEINESIVVKERKELGPVVKIFGKMFKEIIGKELKFEQEDKEEEHDHPHLPEKQD
ncbi:MAG: FKBP-type peptidyl-prolyl cis-trans isomerase [Nanoarchaeota archaeon]